MKTQIDKIPKNPIFAKQLRLITISGKVIIYSHVTKIEAIGKSILIHGESDDVDGTRANFQDVHKIEGLLTIDGDFYCPR